MSNTSWVEERISVKDIKTNVTVALNQELSDSNLIHLIPFEDGYAVVQGHARVQLARKTVDYINAMVLRQ